MYFTAFSFNLTLERLEEEEGKKEKLYENGYNNFPQIKAFRESVKEWVSVREKGTHLFCVEYKEKEVGEGKNKLNCCWM